MATWKKMSVLSLALLVGALSMPVLAQTAPPDNGGGGAAGGNNGGNNGGGNNGGNNRGGGGRNFDPQQVMQRMMERLKGDLGMSDDEFTAVQPKIEAVFKLNNEVNPRMGGMFGGGGRNGRRGGQDGGNGGGAPAAPADQSPLGTARADLQSTLDNKDSTPDQIKAKLDAYRDARSKAKDDLAKAQADLKSVLNQRQEALLVIRGMLD